ncbi:hypothetical protein [Thiohalocapsa sp. ML1]|uniref:hypothetical protein n=1 Tax=Thiohalocapsa sp. ML1 TaxID=1431688 RepID=UPI0012E3B436|nr:hypothetical protein [Thiohalocapsa sp. ML1]
MHQEPVLGEEAGEEHAVPVLVGGLVDEALDVLAPVRATLVAELAAVGAQAPAQRALGLREVPRRVRLADAEMHQGRAGGGLRGVAGGDDDVLELAAQGFCQCVHMRSPSRAVAVLISLSVGCP